MFFIDAVTVSNFKTKYFKRKPTINNNVMKNKKKIKPKTTVETGIRTVLHKINRCTIRITVESSTN